MLCQGRPNSTSAALQSESTVGVLIQTARMCYCMPWPYTTAKIDDRRGLLSPHARAGRTNPEHSNTLPSSFTPDVCLRHTTSTTCFCSAVVVWPGYPASFPIPLRQTSHSGLPSHGHAGPNVSCSRGLGHLFGLISVTSYPCPLANQPQPLPLPRKIPPSCMAQRPLARVTLHGVDSEQTVQV
jgi:hypothetical protein